MREQLLSRIVARRASYARCSTRDTITYTKLPSRTLTTSVQTKHPAVESSITSSAPADLDAPSRPAPSKAAAEFNLPVLDPNTAHDRRSERILNRAGTPPIGSRRRRAALASTSQLPFEQLPYQCFQEARKVLMEDRREKIAQIGVQRARIERLKIAPAAEGCQMQDKMRRLNSMRMHLEELKILADINDPLVKKRFEDGKADLARPIYRHLARQKFLSRRQLILNQRIHQLSVVPDLMPTLDMTYDIALSFTRATSLAPGAFVPSLLSVRPPKLTVQPFDRGERLVTIAILDPDVPDVSHDAFKTRIHFLACNVPLSPVSTTVRLADFTLPAAQPPAAPTTTRSGEPGEPESSLGARFAGPMSANTVIPWLPPYAQKGSPYHRLCTVILEQPRERAIDGEFSGSNHVIDVPATQEWLGGQQLLENGNIVQKNVIKGLASRESVRAVSAFVFRCIWDEGTDSVMERLGAGELVGEELKRKRVEPLPYKKKDGSRYR